MKRTARIYAAEKQIQDLQYSRSRSLNPKDQAAQEKELKHAKRKKQSLLQGLRLNVQLLIGSLLFITLGLAVSRAFVSGLPWWKWLFQIPEGLPQTAGDYTTILTPLLAISVAIERLLETGFNWFEQSSRAVADVLVAPKETLDWIGREYQEAYKATEEAAETVGQDMTPDHLQLLEMTENRLAQAEERLRGWVNAPEYLAWKRALSIWFGLLIGLVIAVLGDLNMLNLLGIPAPRLVDMIITGLVIGSGPGPMHDLLGILQSGKSALSSLSDLAQGKAVKQAVEEVRKETARLQENA
jgi:hypothetical protein